MKRIALLAFVICAAGARLYSLELQLSGGPECSFGSYKFDNSFWYEDKAFYPYVRSFKHYGHEEGRVGFIAPGLGFMVRMFPDTAAKLGFVFRDRAVFAVRWSLDGTAVMDAKEEDMPDGALFLADTFVTLMDFDMGLSSRYHISERMWFYFDVGANITMMDFDSDVDASKSAYLGMGLFTQAALQVNITEKVYLEFGLSTIMNIVSNQKNVIDDANDLYREITYEDSGRFDLCSATPYIHVGYRFSFE